MSRLIASHQWTGDILEQKVSSGSFRYSSSCRLCGMPRYEHTDQEPQDQHYSSWCTTRVLNEKITDALALMRKYRRLSELTNDPGHARLFLNIAETHRQVLRLLFEIHHAARDDGRGSWEKAITRRITRETGTDLEVIS